MASIFTESPLDVNNLRVGDDIRLSGTIKGFSMDQDGVQSLELQSIETELIQNNRDRFSNLRDAMSMAHEPSRQPIPSPS